MAFYIFRAKTNVLPMFAHVEINYIIIFSIKILQECKHTNSHG